MENVIKNYAIYDSPVGKLYIEAENNSIVAIDYMHDTYEFESRSCLITDMAAAQLNEYFAGRRKKFDFPYKLKGTVFQKKVWKELMEIPYGETRSYKQIAEAIGNPKACRAVGMANNHNPIIIAVPCHRVIGSNGNLTGFRCGMDIKQKLLKIEGINLYN